MHEICKAKPPYALLFPCDSPCILHALGNQSFNLLNAVFPYIGVATSLQWAPYLRLGYWLYPPFQDMVRLKKCQESSRRMLWEATRGAPWPQCAWTVNQFLVSKSMSWSCSLARRCILEMEEEEETGVQSPFYTLQPLHHPRLLTADLGIRILLLRLAQSLHL